ncbi:polymorphic toxin type 15 domain-containing protein [Psychromonas sp. PT13]|uniref:polymorphic toxin type 15 domain-containing protein n=1 Tax=Psychromonas sp. PT13 TaxID=3439547 RepID=UPI003EB6F8E2
MSCLFSLHALHNPDMIAGGYDKVTLLGDGSVNSSIGAQWKKRVELMDEAAEQAIKELGPDTKMNVSLQRKL